MEENQTKGHGNGLSFMIELREPNSPRPRVTVPLLTTPFIEKKLDQATISESSDVRDKKDSITF